MRRTRKHESRPKSKRDLYEFESHLYDDYNDELDNDFDNLSDLAEDLHSTDWKDPSRPECKISARRQIERRNELKDLVSEFDSWDDIDRNDAWWD